jgi:hypothetical protein
MMQGAIAKAIAMKKMWMAANLRIVASYSFGCEGKSIAFARLITRGRYDAL